jgi:hypothetical protein
MAESKSDDSSSKAGGGNCSAANDSSCFIDNLEIRSFVRALEGERLRIVFDGGKVEIGRVEVLEEGISIRIFTGSSSNKNEYKEYLINYALIDSIQVAPKEKSSKMPILGYLLGLPAAITGWAFLLSSF